MSVTLLELLGATHSDEKRLHLDKLKKSEIIELIIKQGYDIQSNAKDSKESKAKLNDQNSSHNTLVRMMMGFLGYDIKTDYYDRINVKEYDAVGLMGQVLSTADSSKFTPPEPKKEGC